MKNRNLLIVGALVAGYFIWRKWDADKRAASLSGDEMSNCSGCAGMSNASGRRMTRRSMASPAQGLVSGGGGSRYITCGYGGTPSQCEAECKGRYGKSADYVHPNCYPEGAPN